MGHYYNSAFICACNLFTYQRLMFIAMHLKYWEIVSFTPTKKGFGCSGIGIGGRKVEHSGWWIQMQNVWTSKSNKQRNQISWLWSKRGFYQYFEIYFDRLLIRSSWNIECVLLCLEHFRVSWLNSISNFCHHLNCQQLKQIAKLIIIMKRPAFPKSG